MTKPAVEENLGSITFAAIIFGVLFTLIGMWAGVLPLRDTFSNWWTVRSYIAVPAQVEMVKLTNYRSGKSVVFQLKASFRYEYQGKQYVGERPSFTTMADSGAGYYRKLESELQDAKQRNAPVRLWIDPKAPWHSVYDREIRWQMVAFHIPFAVIFTAVGLGSWILLFHLYMPKSGNTAPPTFEPGNPIVKKEPSSARGVFLFALVFNVVSWPAVVMVDADDHSVPQLVVIWIFIGVFCLVSLLMAFGSWIGWRESRRMGNPILEILQAWPLRARIHFRPAVGLRLPADQLTHQVKVEALLAKGATRSTVEPDTQWQKYVFDASVARGTQTLDFSAELPPAGEESHHQIIVHMADATAIFELPKHAQV